jgi:GntR family transcriptional regulator
LVLKLDLESPVPVSAQLYRQLFILLSSGRVAEGEILPSARRLASNLGIHYHTTNKAFAMLRRDGMVALNHRRQLVARPRPQPGEHYLADWTERQRALLSEALLQGVRPEETLRRFRALLQVAPQTRPDPARGRGT